MKLKSLAECNSAFDLFSLLLGVKTVLGLDKAEAFYLFWQK